METVRIRDGKKSDPGSGINIPDPPHCFKVFYFKNYFASFFLTLNCPKFCLRELSPDGKKKIYVVSKVRSRPQPYLRIAGFF